MVKKDAFYTKLDPLKYLFDAPKVETDAFYSGFDVLKLLIRQHNFLMPVFTIY